MPRHQLLDRHADVGSEEYRRKAIASNKRFSDQASSPDGRHKLSGIHKDQLETYLRETCVMDKILVPEAVDPSECEVGIDNDTLFLKLWFTPSTRAYMGSFESLPSVVQEVFIPRIFMSFLLLQTPRYVLNDWNMAAYPFPVAKQIEDSIGADMQEAKDFVMLKSLEECIQAARDTHSNVIRGEEAVSDIAANGIAGDGLGNTTVFRGLFRRGDMTSLREYFAGTRSTLQQVIIPEINYVQIARWDTSDFGDQLMGQVAQDGYTYDKVDGVKMIRTIKTDTAQGDIFRTGNIYGFASSNEIGRNRTLQGLKFYFDRDHQFMSMDAQFAFGFLWAVSARVAKLELYNGGLRLDNSSVATAYDVSTPGSDELWQDPESVTEKDYYNIGAELHRPQIRFS